MDVKAAHQQSTTTNDGRSAGPTSAGPISASMNKRKPGRPITQPTDNRDLELRREKARERQRRKRAKDKLLLLQKAAESSNANVVQPSASPIIENLTPLPPPPPPAPVHEETHPMTGLIPIDPPPAMEISHPEPPPPPMPIPSPPSRPPISITNTSIAQSAPSGAPAPSSILVSVPASPKPMTDDEVKREKVRRAARERQRKHRALMKAKRMSQMEQGFPLPPVGYTQAHPQHAHHPAGHGPPHPHLLMAPEMVYADHMAAAAFQAQAQAMVEAQTHSTEVRNDPAGLQSQSQPPGSNASIQAQMAGLDGAASFAMTGTPGQNFASTMMLALSCAPMLKAHVMRHFAVGEGEMHAVEQLIAAAWDQWDGIRRFPPSVAPAPQHGSANPSPTRRESDNYSENASVVPASAANQPSSSNTPAGAPQFDFRERFQRTLAQPSPYQRTPPHAGAGSASSPPRKGKHRKSKKPSSKDVVAAHHATEDTDEDADMRDAHEAEYLLHDGS